MHLSECRDFVMEVSCCLELIDLKEPLQLGCLWLPLIMALPETVAAQLGTGSLHSLCGTHDVGEN